MSTSSVAEYRLTFGSPLSGRRRKASRRTARRVHAPGAAQHFQGTFRHSSVVFTTSHLRNTEVGPAPSGIPSEDIARVEAQLQAVIDGIFTAVAQVAQMAARVGPRYKVPLQIATYEDDFAIWVSDHGGPPRTFDLTIDGRPLEVRRKATYLGLRVNDRVTWEPALHRGLTLARVLYAMSLLALTEHQWGRIEPAQHVALRVCLGVPRHASSRLTLAEAGVNAVRNTAGERAMGHLVRIQETRSAASLVALRDITKTATAAAFREDTGRAEAERLAFHATSTTAELAALQLGLRLLDVNEPDLLVVLADSRAALSLLRALYRSPQLAREVVARVGEL
ncbi:hypothetical protein IscW_ISCW018662 [Ixodes scapularis]|uniref:Uncharacterized protein n=1 Tax=Ixodes scapularis TaxID=6945 RepID=B7PQL4_IXOSC|nr:hypothetical protein IscW_ISCW018662 [Ixodes scapularis]|eukprot:XP_002436054.1 hypothetical protein IscW_ISCW018662 [Ixodes scapularis]